MLLKNSTGTLRQLSDRFNIPLATLHGWKKADKSPRKSWVTRKPASTDMERELVDWIKGRRQRGLRVTRRDTSEKAKELAPKFDVGGGLAYGRSCSRRWLAPPCLRVCVPGRVKFTQPVQILFE